MTFSRRATVLLALLGSPLLTRPSAAQPINDPAAAGVDYKVQGEYRGTLPDGKALGCQVMAMGRGTFRAWFLAGGLPGDGWDASAPVGLDGKLDGEQATFGPISDWQAAWAADKVTGHTEIGRASWRERV